MALLQIRVPGIQSCSSRWIEDVFYRHYPHLRRLRLKSFRSLENLANILGTDDDEALLYLIRNIRFYGVEYHTFVLIHPDGVVSEILKKSKRELRKLKITEMT
jgi:hypothetical protein